MTTELAARAMDVIYGIASKSYDVIVVAAAAAIIIVSTYFVWLVQ